MGHDALVRALTFDPCTGRLVSASYDRSVKLWDLGTGEYSKVYQLSLVTEELFFD